MRKIRVLVLLAVLTGLLLGVDASVASDRAGVAAAAEDQPLPGTFLSFESEPGDYIGQGQSRTFTPDNADFVRIRASQENRQLEVMLFPHAGGWWHLFMAAPAGKQLLPGTYENATRWPFQAPSVPGLSFSGDGRGCSTLTGRFTVLEAVYGPSGYIERFHATFEQHCEGATPALFGEVRVINPPPPPPLEFTLTIDEKAAANRIAGSATVSGTIACSQPATVNLFGTLKQRASRFVLITGSFFQSSVACSTTPAPWSATVSGQAGRPFNPGPAELALTAFGIDPNYGGFVSEQATATVYLVGSRPGSQP